MNMIHCFPRRWMANYACCLSPEPSQGLNQTHTTPRPQPVQRIT